MIMAQIAIMGSTEQLFFCLNVTIMLAQESLFLLLRVTVFTFFPGLQNMLVHPVGALGRPVE